MDERPTIWVAVVMRREKLSERMSRWQPWRWVLDSVLDDQQHFGEVPRCLIQDGDAQRWLFPRLPVVLYRDEAEGYQLNITTPAPCYFVLWRMEEEARLAEEPLAVPVAVTLSYNEAGRWLDAQETVEQVPAPPEVVHWMASYVAQHYVVEPKRRKRPESFRSLTDRFGNPATISTLKNGPGRGGQGGG